MKFFEPKPTQYVGIDIGSGGVKLVELRSESKRPYLFTYGVSEDAVAFRTARTDEERQAAIPEVAALVKEVAAAAKTVSTAAVASLPQKDVQSMVITIPKVEEKLFASTVAHEVEKLITFPLVEAVLDTRRLPALPNEAESFKRVERVFVSAARRKTIQLYSDIFQKAGFKLQTIETETFAGVRALIGNDSSPVLIVDMGKNFTSFSYIERTVPYLDMVVELGGDTINSALARAWNKPVEDVESLKKDLFEELGENDDPAITEILTAIYEPTIKQIESVLATVRNSSVGSLGRPDKIILTGGASQCPMLTKKIENHFSIKTYRGDPWSRVMYPPGLKPVLDKLASRCTVAVGLAERLIVS